MVPPPAAPLSGGRVSAPAFQVEPKAEGPLRSRTKVALELRWHGPRAGVLVATAACLLLPLPATSPLAVLLTLQVLDLLLQVLDGRRLPVRLGGAPRGGGAQNSVATTMMLRSLRPWLTA